MTKVTLTNGLVFAFFFTYQQKEKNPQVVTVTASGGIGPADTSIDLNITAKARNHPADHYNKYVGRNLALKYLLQEAGLVEEDRARVWDAFFSTSKRTTKDNRFIKAN